MTNSVSKTSSSTLLTFIMSFSVFSFFKYTERVNGGKKGPFGMV